MKVVIIILRALQMLFSAVVLGLSITIARGQRRGPTPATTGYSSFAGAFGIIAGAVGIASLFIDFLNGIISWAVDALASLILLAGGIAWAIGLKGTSCNNIDTYGLNKLLNCGAESKIKKGQSYQFWCDGLTWQDSAKTIEGRCKMATADDAFLFMAFLVTAGVLAVSFITKRKGGSGSSSYVI